MFVGRVLSTDLEVYNRDYIIEISGFEVMASCHDSTVALIDNIQNFATVALKKIHVQSFYFVCKTRGMLFTSCWGKGVTWWTYNLHKIYFFFY